MGYFLRIHSKCETGLAFILAICYIIHMETRNQVEVVPPYISVAKLDRVLDLAKKRNLSRVSASLFRDYGFGVADAGLAVSLLKFLGALDENGSATNVMANLRLESEERRKQAFQTIVKDSYSKLFAAVAEPYNLSRADLADEFRVQYKQSARVVAGAVPAFLKLCEYAGFVGTGAVAKRSPRSNHQERSRASIKMTSRGSRARSQSAETSGFIPASSHIQPIVRGKMTVTIPEDLFLRAAIDDQLSDEWRKVLKSAHAFAEKYLKETENINGDGQKDT